MERAASSFKNMRLSSDFGANLVIKSRTVCVALSSHARFLGEGSASHSPPPLPPTLSSGDQLVPKSFALLAKGSVHSGSASSDDGGRASPDELRVSSIP